MHRRSAHARRIYTTSTRVAAAARSGLIDLHFAFVVDHADGRLNVLMFGVARKLTLRASDGSNTPSRRSRRSARA